MFPFDGKSQNQTEFEKKVANFDAAAFTKHHGNLS